MRKPTKSHGFNGIKQNCFCCFCCWRLFFWQRFDDISQSVRAYYSETRIRGSGSNSKRSLKPEQRVEGQLLPGRNGQLDGTTPREVFALGTSRGTEPCLCTMTEVRTWGLKTGYHRKKWADFNDPTNLSHVSESSTEELLLVPSCSCSCEVSERQVKSWKENPSSTYTLLTSDFDQYNSQFLR